MNRTKNRYASWSYATSPENGTDAGVGTIEIKPDSPVPMEVILSNEDRLEVGEQVQVEFLILPREER